MSRPQLTAKQTAVYNYLVKALSTGFPPTVREICSYTGIKSTSTVAGILKTLEELEYITRDPYASRAIRINGMTDTTSIPVIGKVTAGQPILTVEEIEDYIPYPASQPQSESLFALKVSGYSMKNAGILDGDIIVADKDVAPRHGDIVVAMIEDEATVKRLILNGEKPYLMPENEDFSPIYPDRMEILGKVIGSIRKY